MEDKEIYEKTYDYEDMKLAIVVQDFLDNFTEKPALIDYEDIIRITQEIKNSWEYKKDNRGLTEEEYAYVQAYAYRFLEENIEELIKEITEE